MDWNHAIRPPKFYPENSFHYNYTFHDHNYPTTVAEVAEHSAANNGLYHHHQQAADKKKRVTTEQLDSLERSFQEEIKLDPDRKMRLAKDLGLPPRQVAIWFQNRRARWKAKQLENLYESLKQKFDLVSKEKFKLQQEVLVLKAMLHEQAQKKQVSKDISCEDTVESSSVWNGRKMATMRCLEINHVMNETGDYSNNNQVAQPSGATATAFWGVITPHQLPTYP